MLSEKVRKQVIQIIGESIEAYRAYEKKWVGEEIAKGNNADKAINVMVVRMLVSLETSWQTAEKELLDLESQIRRLAKRKKSK